MARAQSPTGAGKGRARPIGLAQRIPATAFAGSGVEFIFILSRVRSICGKIVATAS
ncbi:hypothetical protein RV134_350304 [Roseovarius sp. EC-HK134]|nr:hypothetical protein RV134_350304 [Roseovarius sp. EC-HK134]VVT30337.1 hypothetical protein RV420_410224 [Roseovarius sp. EC-SD190]